MQKFAGIQEDKSENIRHNSDRNTVFNAFKLFIHIYKTQKKRIKIKKFSQKHDMKYAEGRKQNDRETK